MQKNGTKMHMSFYHIFSLEQCKSSICTKNHEKSLYQGRTDHLETRALPEGPGSVGGPMRCPWYLFHRLFLSLDKDTGAP
ncbi:unnamed protein product [Staurois parvus]|uniref:Uncharacterized protein n=1 Tax=Staurois parvus TaxID=386267 RepID=A0ABN9F4H5_9NEOB|nr:unnamed protein product [Staurois parvus]